MVFELDLEPYLDWGVGKGGGQQLNRNSMEKYKGMVSADTCTEVEKVLGNIFLKNQNVRLRTFNCVG